MDTARTAFGRCASVAVLALAVAAGCGGGDDDGGPTKADTVKETDEPTATAPGTRNTAGITGSWKGEGTETGPGGTRRRYPVEIEISSLETGATAGTIDYPSFPCAGKLRLDEQRGDAYVFDELIETGVRTCELDGRVELRRDGEQLVYRWSTPKTRNLTVRASLDRE